MDRRSFLKGVIGSIVGFFLGFREKLFTGTKIAVGNDSLQSANGFTAEAWIQHRFKDDYMSALTVDWMTDPDAGTYFEVGP